MRAGIAAFLCFMALLLGWSGSAFAFAAGDACTFANRVYRPEGGGPALICDGSKLVAYRDVITGPVREGIITTTPVVTLDVDGTIRISYAGETCSSNTAGAIRYTSSNSNLSFCDGSSWLTLENSGSGVSAAGSSTQIQFNSGGVLTASAGFVYTTAGDLLVAGTNTNTASVPASGSGTRMFFDPSMGAFRAGGVLGTRWDNANIGQYSVAAGYNTTASGSYSMALGSGTTASGSVSTAMGSNTTASGSTSIAMGVSTTASGPESVAMGYYTTAIGQYSMATGNHTIASGGTSMAMGVNATASGVESMAMGTYVTAGDGTAGDGKGDYSLALGLGNSFGVASEVTGTSSFGIFMGNQGNINLSSPNTMGLFGGKMVIDPNVPATHFTAATALDVNGSIRIADGGETCSSTIVGAIRYGSASLYYCDGSAWQTLEKVGAPASAAGNNYDIQFNNGGVLGASDTFQLESDGDLLLKGTYSGTASPPASGAGDRMFFDTQTAAFRAGRVTSTQWDSANEGVDSVAMGYNPTASGAQSIALGYTATASAGSTTAVGYNAQATGLNSQAFGYGSNAGNSGALAAGYSAAASGGYAVALGKATAGGGESVALGYNANAGGIYGLAIGGSSSSTGTDGMAVGYSATSVNTGSKAIGNSVTASGTESTAIGYKVTAGDGSTAGTGMYSMALGVGNPTGVTPEVTGSSSLGIFIGNQSGVNFAATSTMGVFGGKMVIDPSVPATYLTPATALDVNGTIKIADGGETCSSTTAGAIKYNGGSLYYCNGASWLTLENSGSTESAAGNDREIQFNSGGALSSSAGFKLMSDGDLLLTGTNAGTASVPVSGAGERLFFDTGSGALRAGGVTGTNWDNASVGKYSVAMGLDTKASNTYSVAMGDVAVASGVGSVAMGGNTTAVGSYSMAMGDYAYAGGTSSIAVGQSVATSFNYSVAMGYNAKADAANTFALGEDIRVAGQYSFGLGLGPSGSTYPKVSGASSFGIFMGNQNGVVFSSADTVGLFGGKMVIDPNAPSTYLVPATALDVNGSIKIADGGETCSSTTAGAIRYGSATLYYCNGSSWTSLGGGGSASAAGSTREIQFNSGGSFGASSTFKLESDGDLLLTGTYTGTASVPTTGAGTRMFFDTQDAAFRAGNVDSTQWDNTNVGPYSAAMGFDTTASGLYSTALGNATTASGGESFAVGLGAAAIGDGGSVATGFHTTASGYGSIALGYAAKAGDGTYGDTKGDYSMAIGLTGSLTTSYPQVTGQKSLGIFMGTQTNVNVTDNQVMAILGGKVLIDPNAPATYSTPQATLDVKGYMRLSTNSAQPAACSSSNDGAIALTHVYTMCVCKGGSSSWVETGDGTTACSW